MKIINRTKRKIYKILEMMNRLLTKPCLKELKQKLITLYIISKTFEKENMEEFY